MQWFAFVGIVIFTVLAGGVKAILAFSFCAIVSFIFTRNLLDEENKLDFTGYFASKGLGLTRKREVLSSIRPKPFPRGLKTCRHTLVKNILRDFVISWYENVGIGGHFILETRSLLEEATVNFYDKVARTSVSAHTEKLCGLLHRHLVATQAVKTSMAKNHKESQNFVEIYRSLQEKSRAYQNDELQYLRNVTDLLLYKLIASKTLGCNTGRFILREILTVKLLLPLVDTISDPDFVNTSIINIFGESKDENLPPTSLEFNETSKSNLKATTPLMEYLDQNFESSSSSTKLIQSESATKYKFKDATVVEKEHKEIVEISMEAQETNSTLNTVGPDDTGVQSPGVVLKTSADTACKASEYCESKKPKLTHKAQSHSSILLNGLSKVKNDIFKPHSEKEQNLNSKRKAIFSAKIYPSGIMFPRPIPKVNSSPVIMQNTSTNLGEKLSGELIPEPVSDTEGCVDLSKENEKDLESFSQGRSTSLSCETSSFETKRCSAEQNRSQSNPNFNTGPIERESISSFEEVDFYDICAKPQVAENPDSRDLTKEHLIVEGEKFEVLSNDEKSKLQVVQKNSSPSRNRQQTMSFSSDEWDSEVFEKSEDDFLEADEVESSPKSAGMEDDNVSKADLAIHDVPSPCSMISIPSTELVTDHSFEPYKSKYTVYVIVYNKQLWPRPESDEHPEMERSEADTQGSIKRRYREFMELHHRLISRSFASFMKDIPKPNRKFNSPFFRLDQDVIEGRQQLLENYLKCLVNKPAILNCEYFKGFLGIGDESHTDFRRQNPVVPTLPNVPRIDKKLQKKVTKFIDHIKTAFDTGPVDGDKEEEYEDIRQVLGEDKTQDEIRTFATSSGDCKLNHSCCYSDNCFHTFIQQHQEQSVPPSDHPTPDPTQSKETRPTNRLHQTNTCTENGHASNNLRPEKHSPSLNRFKNTRVPIKRKRGTTVDNSGSSMCGGQMQDQETNPLTKTVLNLSCQLLEKQESWVCLEPVQEAATAVFGCFLEWWMESQLSELVTVEQWKYYLSLLTDTVWPGGELMKASEQEKTEEEKLKTKEEAIETLSDFFGAVFHAAVGKETIDSSAREIVESLQHSEVNRQVLLEVLEVILVEVFPDLMAKKDSYLSSRNC